jgi:hypothetical protein
VLLACSFVLACRGGGLHIGRTTHTHRGGVVSLTCGRDIGTCYDRAADACPYGYDGLSSELQQAGTVVNSTVVGNQTYANAVPIYRGQLVVRCRPALACEHARCATGLVCVDSKRYPGRRVCALP